MNTLQLKIHLQAVEKVSGPFQRILKGSEGLRQALAQNEKQLAQLRGYQGLRGELEATENQISETRSQLSFLQAIEKSGAKLTKDQAKQYKKLEKSLASLEAKRKTQIRSTRAQATALKTAGLAVKNLSAHETRLQQQSDRTSAALDRQTARAEALRRITGKVTKAKENMHRAMGQAANMSFVGGAGVLAGQATYQRLSNLASSGISFEAKMSGVGAVLNLDRRSEELRKLQAHAEKLGQTTAFTASETALGMQELARTGFNPEQILNSIADVQNLAKATDTGLAESAKMSSDIMMAMGIPASEMTKTADSLAYTANRSNNTFTELGEAMKYAAPIANTLGLEMDDLLAYFAKMGDQGIKASMSGTSMRRILANLVSDEGAIKTLRNLGIETMDGFGDARDPLEILKELDSTIQHMGSGEKMQIFKDIAGQNALSAMNILMDTLQGNAEFKAELKLNTGYADQAAKAMMDNTQGSIDLMKSAWEGLNIAILNAQGGGLRELIDQVSEVIGRITEWVKLNPELAGGLLKFAAIGAGLLTTFGAFLLLMSPLVIGLKSLGAVFGITWAVAAGLFKVIGGVAAFKAVVAFIKSLTVVQWALNSALLANPIGAFITGLVGLIAIGALIYSQWDSIKSFFVGLFDWLRENIPFLDTIINAVSGVMDALGSAWDYIMGNDPPDVEIKSGHPILASTRVTENITKNITTPVIRHPRLESEVAPYKRWTDFRDFMTGLFDGLQQMIGAFFDGVAKTLSMITAPITAVWDVLVATNPFDVLQQALDQLASTGAFLAEQWQGITSIFSGLFDWLRAQMPFLDTIISAVSSFTNPFSGILDMVLGDDAEGTTSSTENLTRNITTTPIIPHPRLAGAITDNSQVHMTLNVNGGDPAEVERVIRNELEAHERKKVHRARGRYNTQG